MVFNINRYTVKAYLKSGQTVKFTCSKYRVEADSSELKGYSFEKLYPRWQMPIDQITGFSFHAPIWRRIIQWLVN